MAEILIQRRRHRNVWPWLLGLLALALLPLPFLAADRDDRPTDRRAAARRDTTAPRDTTPPADTAAQPIGAGIVPSAGGAGGGGGAPSGAQGTAAAAAPTSGAATPGPATSAPAASGPTDRTTATAAGSLAAPSAGTRAPAAAGTPAAGTTPTPSAAPAASRPAATTFAGFIAARNANASEAEHRQYTAQGLRMLADELRALGASAAGVRAIRANADSLMMTRGRRNAHPDYARAAFLAATRELDVLRGRFRAPVDTGRLRAVAWSIRPDRQLHAQRDTVQTFFETARDALQAVSRNRSRRGR